MKKLDRKKLVLSTQTIALLDDTKLAGVGGGVAKSQPLSCTCATHDNSCFDSCKCLAG